MFANDLVFSMSFQCDIDYYLQVNYNDGGVIDTPQDSTWQENLSDYNSDFSTPSDDDKEDDDFDEKNDGE